jgi:hypothetical protein
MSSITATIWVTLDGVVQGLGRPDEDTRGGFTHGGWGPRYSDEVMSREMAEAMARPGDMLFGRRTWQDFITAWARLQFVLVGRRVLVEVLLVLPDPGDVLGCGLLDLLEFRRFFVDLDQAAIPFAMPTPGPAEDPHNRLPVQCGVWRARLALAFTCEGSGYKVYPPRTPAIPHVR